MLIAALLTLAFAASPDFDALWQEFHSAGDPLSREVAWVELQRSGWPQDFAATLDRLQHRPYRADVPTGVLREQRVDFERREFRYTVLIPSTYDPEHAYPLQMVLHGSTRRPAWRKDEAHWRWIEPFRSENIITVFPAAWDEAMWWSDRQIDNLRAILDRLRAKYHVDSNRCYLTGLSDGGTGTFYHALRAPTPWAAFLPLIGHPWVLGNREEGADGDMFAANLRGRAVFAVNSRDDHLYPAKSLGPYLNLFERAGAHVQFKAKDGGHHVRWWPEEAASFRAFRTEHPRDPFPDELAWETDDPNRNGRAFWLETHEIGEEPAPDLDPFNTVLFPELDPPTRAQAFPRRRPSGRIELRHDGNTIHVTSHNVKQFELLLGVEEFEFDRPVRVLVNGIEQSHEVSPSLETMLRWAIRDGDPAMLYAASIVVINR